MLTNKHIFISHSSADNDMARVVADVLRDRGCVVWLDEQNLDYGRFREHIEHELLQCQIFFALLSEDALKSRWVAREIDAALSLEAQTEMLLVPIIIRPCTLPLLLRGYKYLNFTKHDPVTELDTFLQRIDTTQTHQEHSMAPTHSRTTSTTDSTPPKQAQTAARNYSIGNITADAVDIHQGDRTTYIYNTGSSSPPRVNPKLQQAFQVLITDLTQAVDSQQPLDDQRVEAFITMMYTILSENIQLPAKLLAEARLLCKQLQILPLI